jgi:hypothetical protein
VVSDKRRSVELALAEWPKLSDRELARICAVGHPFVGDVRKAQVESDSTYQPQTRIGGDGKERKPPTKPAPLPVAPAAEPAPVNTPSTAESQPDANPDAANYRQAITVAISPARSPNG